jgi:RND family efflux transporter MFP subunit
MKKFIGLLVVLAILGGVGWGGYAYYKSGEKKEKAFDPKRMPVAVSVAPATRKDIPFTLSAVGTVVTEQSVAVRSRIDSQLLEVKFKDGDEVKQGDLLFVLDSRAIEAQMAQQQANSARDRAQLENLKRQYDRIKGLSEKGFATTSGLDEARAAYEAQVATVNAAQAAINNMKVQIEYSRIMAPIGGRTGTINVTVGNTVKANDATPLVTINQVKPIRVQVSIPQKYLDAVRKAMAAGAVEVGALHEGPQTPSPGRLDYIDNSIDETTGTFTARASFANEDEALWPGMFVTATIRLGDQKGALTVPEVAIQHGQDGAEFVFVIEGGKAKKRPVKTERVQDGLALIAEGLNDGEQVATDGLMKLEDGSSVTVPGGADARPEAK